VERGLAGREGSLLQRQSDALGLDVTGRHGTGLHELEVLLEELDDGLAADRRLSLTREDLLAALTGDVLQVRGLQRPEADSVDALVPELVVATACELVELVPRPRSVVRHLDAGLVEHLRVVGHGVERDAHGRTVERAVDLAGLQHVVLHTGQVESVQAAEIAQGALLAVGGALALVHLDDVRHVTGRGLGVQPVPVRLPRRPLRLDPDIRVFLLEQVDDLLRQVAASVCTPPGEAQLDRTVTTPAVVTAALFLEVLRLAAGGQGQAAGRGDGGQPATAYAACVPQSVPCHVSSGTSSPRSWSMAPGQVA